MKTPARADSLQSVRPRAKSGLVLICSDCGKRCGRGRWRKFEAWLEAELKARGLKKQIDVVRVSCLGYCPKGRVAVALAAALEPAPAQRFWLVEPREGRSAFWAALREYFDFAG